MMKLQIITLYERAYGGNSSLVKDVIITSWFMERKPHLSLVSPSAFPRRDALHRSNRSSALASVMPREYVLPSAEQGEWDQFLGSPETLSALLMTMGMSAFMDWMAMQRRRRLVASGAWWVWCGDCQHGYASRARDPFLAATVSTCLQSGLAASSGVRPAS